jgi:5'-methylthioadenosine phosphorylase
MKIGIIGGSGLDDPALLADFEEKEVETPYGPPSSVITCGKLAGVEVCILARHGKTHGIPPTQVNYRANIYALKKLGCTHILATNAIGSLKEAIKPGDLVFPDQFIDFTKQRKNTFYDKVGEVVYTEMADPFSDYLRKILIKSAEELGLSKHNRATLVVIEGPRFSTRAESFMFRYHADIIGMTAVPECNLAKELGIPYSSIAMTTDYDCWKEGEEPVTWEMILKRMEENADKVKKLLMQAIPKIARQEITPTDLAFLKNKIQTIPNWPKPGVMFRDITTLLRDNEGFQKLTEVLTERYKNKDFDVIAGIESRGFIIGSILANKLNKPFIPIRKPGKLPPETIKQEYSLEYGTDAVEISKNAISLGQKVLLIDDLIATGGTAQASASLIEKLGGRIIEISFVIELPELRGREKLSKWPVYSMIKFEGE